MAEAERRAGSPLPVVAYIGTTRGHVSKMWSKTPPRKPRPPGCTVWSCQTDPVENMNDRGDHQTSSHAPTSAVDEGCRKAHVCLFDLWQLQATSWIARKHYCSLSSGGLPFQALIQETGRFGLDYFLTQKRSKCMPPWNAHWGNSCEWGRGILLLMVYRSVAKDVKLTGLELSRKHSSHSPLLVRVIGMGQMGGRKGFTSLTPGLKCLWALVAVSKPSIFSHRLSSQEDQACFSPQKLVFLVQQNFWHIWSFQFKKRRCWLCLKTDEWPLFL